MSARVKVRAARLAGPRPMRARRVVSSEIGPLVRESRSHRALKIAAESTGLVALALALVGIGVISWPL